MEVYVTRDGSETCFSLNPPNAFCAQNGTVKEVRLDLTFSWYEVYEEKIREVYRPQGVIGIRHGYEGVRENTLATFHREMFFKIYKVVFLIAYASR